MLKSYRVVVAHGILVSAQVPLVLTLDFGTSDLGLTIIWALISIYLSHMYEFYLFVQRFQTQANKSLVTHLSMQM